MNSNTRNKYSCLSWIHDIYWWCNVYYCINIILITLCGFACKLTGHKHCLPYRYAISYAIYACLKVIPCKVDEKDVMPIRKRTQKPISLWIYLLCTIFSCSAANIFLNSRHFHSFNEFSMFFFLSAFDPSWHLFTSKKMSTLMWRCSSTTAFITLETYFYIAFN